MSHESPKPEAKTPHPPEHSGQGKPGESCDPPHHEHHDDAPHHHPHHAPHCEPPPICGAEEEARYCDCPRCCERRRCGPGSGGGGGHGGGSGQGGGGHGGGGGGGGQGGGGSGQTGNPGRPGKSDGGSRGRVPSPVPLGPGDFNPPPGTWAGARPDLYLPFLFMRANPGDTGGRLNPDGSRMQGVFWESPDVLILAGADPSTAPSVPPELGQVALAGQPNTIYAHVWNFGQAQAAEVVVEFYWCDPSLGINAASAHLIDQVFLSLGARGSGRAHALVKCPTPWTPTFLNGGHECLLVRVWDYCSDSLGKPEWDASINRHIGQRNIHVVPAPAGGQMRSAGLHAEALPFALPSPTPLLLNVGPLYGEPAQVTVARVAPNAMPWLQLRTGVRGQFPVQAMPTGVASISKPLTIGGGVPVGGSGGTQKVHGDDQQVAFTTTDARPAPGQAHVYRVSASQGGQVFGGYTVVLMG